MLAEELRPQARDTVQFFHDEGVELKVMSGDAPETVGAIARDAGIEGEARGGRRAARASSSRASVVGRISPEGKKAVVEALRDRGRYVAMVGDGVNDVPALKASRLAIAQGSGSEMARSVADVVLVNGDFAAVPEMVAQGRKILRNLQRVTKLFAAKSAFAAFLILSIGLTDEPYPLLPRHLTLAATLTVGIPAFFLALAPSSGPWRTEGFLREVGRFAVPAGTFAGIGVLFVVPVLPQRRRRPARGGADGRDHGADRGRALPRRRAGGGAGHAADAGSSGLVGGLVARPTWSSSPSAACATSSGSRRSAAGAARRRSAGSPSRSAACSLTDDRFLPGALRRRLRPLRGRC